MFQLAHTPPVTLNTKKDPRTWWHGSTFTICLNSDSTDNFFCSSAHFSMGENTNNFSKTDIEVHFLSLNTKNSISVRKIPYALNQKWDIFKNINQERNFVQSKNDNFSTSHDILLKCEIRYQKLTCFRVTQISTDANSIMLSTKCAIKIETHTVMISANSLKFLKYHKKYLCDAFHVNSFIYVKKSSGKIIYFYRSLKKNTKNCTFF